jgi:hypothetical protein
MRVPELIGGSVFSECGPLRIPASVIPAGMPESSAMEGNAESCKKASGLAARLLSFPDLRRLATAASLPSLALDPGIPAGMTVWPGSRHPYLDDGLAWIPATLPG